MYVNVGEPKFLSPEDKLQSINVTEGDEVRLPCRVTAEPVADIRWLRNGVPLDRKLLFYFLQTCTGSFCNMWNGTVFQFEMFSVSYATIIMDELWHGCWISTLVELRR